MHPRLDPACADAQALDKAHAKQRRLMLDGKTEGRLATVLRETQAKQTEMHVAACARCASFDPRCGHCGFDPRMERHGWMCPNQRSRWADVFPWNWRASRAAAPPARSRRSEGMETPSAARPASASATTAPPPHRPAQPPPARRVAVQPEPQKVSPYTILGVTPSSSEEQVRAAFREKARQYHPDKVAHLGPELRVVAERKMREINAAYEMIRATWERKAA